MTGLPGIASISVDADQNISGFDSAASAIFGYVPEEVIGRPLDILIPARFREAHHAHIEGFMADEPDFRLMDDRLDVEIIGVRNDGSEFFAEAAISRGSSGSAGLMTVYLRDISARKATETALIQDQEKYRDMVESVSHAVFQVDAHGLFTHLNPRFFDLTGYLPEELISKHFTVIVAPESRAEVDAFYSRQLTDNIQETAFQFPIDTRSGQRRWIEQTVTIETVDGRVQGFQGVAHDITERLDAEKALERVEAGNRTLAEENGIIAELARVVGSARGIGEFINAFAKEFGKLISFDRVSVGLLDESEMDLFFAYLADPHEEEAYICEEVHAMQGICQEIISNKLGAIVDDRESLSQAKSSGLFECKGEMDIGSVLIVPILWNGGVFGILALASAQVDAFDQKDVALAERAAYQVGGKLAAARLQAEWQRTQHDLLRSEEFHRNLLDNYLDGVVLVMGGDVQYANPAMCQLSGYSVEELIGRSALEFVSKEYRQKVADRMQRVLEGSLLKTLEYELLRKNGGTVPIEASSQPIRVGEQQGYLSVIRDITLRKKVERALADAEEKYRDLVENAVIGIYQSVPNGGYVRANNALISMLGYDSFEDLIDGIPIIGDDLFVDQDYRHKVNDQLHKDGSVSGFEFEAYRKDGSTMWISMTARSITDETGRPINFEGTIEDITARKRAEEALQEAKATLEVTVAERTARLRRANNSLQGELVNRQAAETALQESEKRSRSIIEAIPDLIFRINRSGVLLDYVVPDDLVSLKPESWLNNHISDVVSADFADEIMIHVKRALSTQQVQTFEHSLQMPLLDGGLREMEGRIVVNGEDEVLAIIRDITEAKEARRSLDREAREREVLGEIGRIIGSTLDIGQIYRKFAQEVRRLISFERLTISCVDSRHESVTIVFSEGWPLLDRTPHEPFPLEGSIIESVVRDRTKLLMRGDVKEDVEKFRAFTLAGHDFENKMKSLLAVPLVSKDVVIGALMLRSPDSEMYGARELSLVERLGAQMAGAMANAQDAEERGALEEQLAQSQKMEVIGQLAGGVAHDFNNFLTPIIGYSHLAVASENLDERIKNYMEEVYNAAERASNLTNQLLAFSRRQIIEPKIVDLNALISNVESMIHSLIGENIELTFEADPDIGRVRVDTGQIEQVLANLAANARDAMPHGGSLLIETGVERVRRTKGRRKLDLPPGTYVVMKVTDSGTGMPDNVKERIFEPFFTTKEVGKGTGLGLSTCYGIIKQNSGDLVVESELGRGTQFKIYLPRTNEQVSPPAEREMIGDVEGGTETVLLVEDEAVVRRIAHRVLEGRGYNVLQAENGGEALRIVEEMDDADHIDLLLTDVIMPQMGGRQLVDIFSTKCPDSKVLYMSGYTDDAIDHHGVLEDDVQLLRKPFTPTVLAHKVRDLLDS